MASFTPILHLPEVAPNQNQKEDTINTQAAILEAASNDSVLLAVTTGTFNVNADQFTRYFLHRYTGHTDALVVAVIPNTPRWFCTRNEGAFPMALKIFGLPTTYTLAAGKQVLWVTDGETLRAVSEGVSQLADLSDVDGSQTPSNGQILAWIASGSRWEAVDNPADLDAYAPAFGSNFVLTRRAFVRPAFYFSNFLGSVAKAGVAASASTVFAVKKNGVTIGSITFAAAATTGTFSTDVGAGSSSLTVGAGDILSIQAPASVDATLADVTICLKGLFT